MQAKLRQVYKLNLTNGWTMEAIMIPKMKLQLQSQIIPEAWQDLNGEWADQDTYGVSAQILLGADQATLFPHAVKEWTGSLMQINQALLMQSEITGRYMIYSEHIVGTTHTPGAGIHGSEATKSSKTNQIPPLKMYSFPLWTQCTLMNPTA